MAESPIPSYDPFDNVLMRSREGAFGTSEADRCWTHSMCEGQSLAFTTPPRDPCQGLCSDVPKQSRWRRSDAEVPDHKNCLCIKQESLGSAIERQESLGSAILGSSRKRGCCDGDGLLCQDIVPRTEKRICPVGEGRDIIKVSQAAGVHALLLQIIKIPEVLYSLVTGLIMSTWADPRQGALGSFTSGKAHLAGTIALYSHHNHGKLHGPSNITSEDVTQDNVEKMIKKLRIACNEKQDVECHRLLHSIAEVSREGDADLRTFIAKKGRHIFAKVLRSPSTSPASRNAKACVAWALIWLAVEENLRQLIAEVCLSGLKRVISVECPNGSTDAVYALTILGLDPVVLKRMIRYTMEKFPAVESKQQSYCYAPRAVQFCKPLLVRMYETVLSP